LSGRGLCDELITRPEESYRLCCVVVCDLETSRMGAPHIYDISRLRVNGQKVARSLIETVTYHAVLKFTEYSGHCATNRKATGLIPDSVIGIFHWHNTSGCTMALGSAQPLTEMSTRNISWE